MGPPAYLLYPLMLLSLLLLSTGEYLYRKKDRRFKLLFASGGIVFSLYWALYVPQYLLNEGDVVNATIISLGVVFFAYMGDEARKDYIWGEDTRSLNWLYRTTFYASLIYFTFKHLPYVGGVLIWLIALQSVAVLSAVGYPVWASPHIPIHSTEGVPIHAAAGEPITVSIVFSCTALQALAIFFSAVYTTELNRWEWIGWARRKIKELERKGGFLNAFRLRSLRRLVDMDDERRKRLSYLYTLPVIYVGNLFRNAGVIYVTYEGIFTFYVAHNYIGKSLSLGLMLALMLLLFHYLPELQENVVGLVDLTKRKMKGQIREGRFVLEE
ncbi:MAG: hypothetical protein J7K08_00540 [Thermoplasmata archaeon]|nr:hypothetical protein [Thermoplasmata archaeon]HDD59596.1 hypothetical protein [Euryarchaeota archaeon]RLF56033.1 MAG: hypothetical protein DRN28_01720 [Thermoplasmata archaeon]RLF71129.1 MAG: hypothetical protein DRN40_03130 [Thermoplasmata archaeon]RLF71720.1 MAG: hypothetical protein DRN35_01925 [Thermoplasmata archaeon]